jgi:hypothetical protein
MAELFGTELDITTKTTSAFKCIKIRILYGKHNIPTTCSGNSYGNSQGGALQRMELSRYYRRLLTNSQI